LVNIKQECLSVEGRPPARVYSVTLVWPWPWPWPWPRYY